MWRLIGRVLAVMGGATVAGSFAGDLHPLGDSLAVFRPVWIIGTLVMCGLVWRSAISRAVAAGAVVAVALTVFPAWTWEAPKSQASVTVYQKNLLFRPTDRTEFMADVLASPPDFVTLQEVSRANEPVLEVLQVTYPHQLLCNGHSVGAVAILSKTPLDQTTCGTQPGFARAVTVVNGTPVQVISLHLFWPWPHRQAEQVAALIAELSPLEGGMTVVGGDFNMVAEGRSLAAIERATGTLRVGARVTTYELLGAYPLGIDHVLATGGTGIVSVRPLLGADHYGLFAGVEWP